MHTTNSDPGCHLHLSGAQEKSHLTMTVSDDACALIVQAVACAAAEILHQEESAATSRVGTTAVVRV